MGLRERDTNLIDPSGWTVGSAGSQSRFSRNGSDTENYIIEDTDPWGKTNTVWEARPDYSSGPDGGWNGASFPIDNTQMYRISVWVRRTNKGNGHFYMGCNGYGPTNGVLNRSNGSNNTNPYFTVNANWNEWGDVGSWYLAVGHIWPAGSGTGGIHNDSGIYDTAGTKIYDSDLANYVWRTDTERGRERTYLYYSTDTSTRQQWIYPRMEIVDGTEPSIAELIEGLDRLFRIVSNYVEINQISEVGPADGLVGYWPLNGNIEDYSGNEYNGYTDSSYSNGGIEVDTNSYIYLPWEALPYGKQITISFWANVTVSSTNSIFESAYSDNIYLNSRRNTNIHLLYSNGNTYWDCGAKIGQTYDRMSIPNPVGLNEWHHWAFIKSVSAGYMAIYVDGVLAGEATGKERDIIPAERWKNTGVNITRNFTGLLRDIRFYNRSLNQGEIEVLYNRNNARIFHNRMFVKELREEL